jgi:hypothetical protein
MNFKKQYESLLTTKIRKNIKRLVGSSFKYSIDHFEVFVIIKAFVTIPIKIITRQIE